MGPSEEPVQLPGEPWECSLPTFTPHHHQQGDPLLGESWECSLPPPAPPPSKGCELSPTWDSQRQPRADDGWSCAYPLLGTHQGCRLSEGKPVTPQTAQNLDTVGCPYWSVAGRSSPNPASLCRPGPSLAAGFRKAHSLLVLVRLLELRVRRGWLGSASAALRVT